jgi:3-deoxy-manno-octulosonate cytidylyltransferase (CMP-KDO synthetase)
VTGRPRVIAVIPARYASTRLPGKPLVDLCGKPMIRRVVEQASRASLVDRVVVATDHDAIASAVRAFGGEVVMTPADCPTGSDRIAHVVRGIPDATIVVNVQGDEPLIDPAMIDECVAPLCSDSSIEVGTLVRLITSWKDLGNPAVVKAVLDRRGNALYFSRSPIPCLRDGGDPSLWHLEHHYYKHIGLYAFRRETLLRFTSWEATPLERAEKLEQLRLLEHGVGIRATVTSRDSIAVDTAEDAERVRSILENAQ